MENIPVENENRLFNPLFNWIGLGMFLFGEIIGGVISWSVGKFDTPKLAIIIMGGFCFVVDLLYRFLKGNSNISEFWYVHPKCGGYILCIPMWFLGILALFLGMFMS